MLSAIGFIISEDELSAIKISNINSIKRICLNGEYHVKINDLVVTSSNLTIEQIRKIIILIIESIRYEPNSNYKIKDFIDKVKWS